MSAASSARLRRARVAVDGIQVRTIEAGPAEATEALVFVHGNPGSADDWERLAAAAGAHVRAVAFDLPDFGETVAPGGFAHTVPSYAAFLDRLLGVLGIERVHLLVHDFGGPIGLEWAAAHPERLASIVLVDIGVLPGYRWHVLARLWRTPVLGELFQATATRPAFRFLINRSEPRGLPRPFVEKMYDHYDRRTRRAVLELYRATDDPAAMSTALAEVLRGREVPALVIWGEHDAYLPSSYAMRQRETFRSADVHVLPASGHWPFADAPETVERLLVEFVQRVGAPA
jgi:pimeloyl-ACP methyl ester carboxylesterase